MDFLLSRATYVHLQLSQLALEHACTPLFISGFPFFRFEFALHKLLTYAACLAWVCGSALIEAQNKSRVMENGRLAPARAALAEQPWGSIWRVDHGRGGLPARLGAH